MKRYSVAVVRERLAEALNDVDRGIPVIIERRGVRYRLSRELEQKRRPSRRSVIEHAEPDVVSGEWSWEWAPGGLQLASGTKGRKRRA